MLSFLVFRKGPNLRIYTIKDPTKQIKRNSCKWGFFQKITTIKVSSSIYRISNKGERRYKYKISLYSEYIKQKFLIVCWDKGILQEMQICFQHFLSQLVTQLFSSCFSSSSFCSFQTTMDQSSLQGDSTNGRIFYGEYLEGGSQFDLLQFSTLYICNRQKIWMSFKTAAKVIFKIPANELFV